MAYSFAYTGDEQPILSCLLNENAIAIVWTTTVIFWTIDVAGAVKSGAAICGVNEYTPSAIQAIFRRRRHQPSRPTLAKIRARKLWLEASELAALGPSPS